VTTKYSVNSSASGNRIPVTPATFTSGVIPPTNVNVTGMTANGHCSVTPTNSSAAADMAAGNVYISGKSANQVTVQHSSTSGMTFDVLCRSH